MKTKNQVKQIIQISTGGLIAILVIMPFHAFLSIMLGHIFGHQTWFQAWKEILFLVLAGIWVYNCILKKKILFKFNVVNITALFIIALGLVVSLIARPELNGLFFGIKTDLVPLGLFLISQAYADEFSDNSLLRLLLIPALIVSILAIFQVTVVPYQLLALVGYSSQTINPIQLIDVSAGIARAFSTLGGPNQMGTYLILPSALALAALLKTKKIVYLPILAFLLLAIGLSFSRSSWVGAIVALLITAFLFLPNKLKLWLGIATITVAALLSVVILPKLSNSNNVVLQNIILHGQFFSNKTIGPPDVVRGGALTRGFELVIKEPWGHGLGTAGPASYHTNSQLITENWYIQVTYEYGWLGLMAFLVFFAALIVDLLARARTAITIGTVGALVGILVANLFLHSWADSTLALIAFVIFGLLEGRSK